MASAHTLADPTVVTALGAMSPEDALDLGDSDVLALEFLLPEKATTGTVTIEHAALRDESAFTSTGVTFDLASGAASVQTDVAEGLLRFVRWNVTALTGGPPTFAIYCIKRP